MGDTTHFTIEDYDILSAALDVFTDSLSDTQADIALEKLARSTRRKIRRRLGRQLKAQKQDAPVSTQVDRFVEGRYFNIEADKLDQVVKLMYSMEHLTRPEVIDLLLNTDRRTSDDHHQTFLYESSPEDIAEWLEFIYSIDVRR